MGRGELGLCVAEGMAWGEAGGFGARGGVGDLPVWPWGQRLLGCQGEASPHACALAEEGRAYGRT